MKQRKRVMHEVLPATARVIKKIRESELNTTIMWVSGYFSPANYYIISHYNIYLLCGGVKYCIDDPKLFASVKEGEYIPVSIHREKKGKEIIYLSVVD